MEPLLPLESFGSTGMGIVITCCWVLGEGIVLEDGGNSADGGLFNEVTLFGLEKILSSFFLKLIGSAEVSPSTSAVTLKLTGESARGKVADFGEEG